MKIILLSLVLIMVMQTASAETVVELNKAEKPDFGGTRYTVKTDQCGIEWIVKYFSEGSGFGFSEHSSCKLPLAQQQPYRSMLLKKLMQDTQNLQGMRNFYWGRLQRGDSNDEYALRLTRAVAKSKHWDRDKGALVGYPQGINQFIMDRLNQEQVFAEVIETFAQNGFEIRVNDVDTVLMGNNLADPADESSKNKFPVDCTVSFEVLRKKNLTKPKIKRKHDKA